MANAANDQVDYWNDVEMDEEQDRTIKFVSNWAVRSAGLVICLFIQFTAAITVFSFVGRITWGPLEPFLLQYFPRRTLPIDEDGELEEEMMEAAQAVPPEDSDSEDDD